MAARSKLASQIQTFGIVGEGFEFQRDFDCGAFAARYGTEKTLMRRTDLFRRLAEAWLPKHFEWHAWTNKIVESMCHRPMICFPGCSGACVAGETRLENPITGERPTIQELCENQMAPIVMTLDGPVQADVPYLKGIQELFEITLENGSRFSATAEHRICVSCDDSTKLHPPRFSRVSDLRIGQYLPSYERVRPVSTSEHGLLAREQGVLCSQKKAEDYQGNCSHDHHPCGALPRSSEGIGQSFFPSPDDVQKHNRATFYLDDLENECKRNRLLLSYGRLSMNGSESRHNSLGTVAEYLPDPETPSRDDRWFRQRVRFRLTHKGLSPFSELTHGSFDIESREGASRQMDKVSSFNFRVSQSRIASIRNTGKHNFYDLCVPGVHHYFAEGTIHHNSKTFGVVSFSAVWWLASPSESSVTLISTSKGSLRQRGWAEVQRIYSRLGIEKLGNFVDSQMAWQVTPGDTKHAIRCKAVEEGPLQRVADDIKGVHTRRQMVIIDEATSVPKAIYEALSNLYSYPDEFIVVLIGNPPASKLNQFSQYCEPREGWSSVDIDTEEWDGKPIASLGGLTPYIIRFDAEKSPNITEGKKVSSHLPTKEKVQAAKNSSGGQTPSYWSNFRGFWPPEGLSKNVFSDSLLEHGDAYGKFIFDGDKFMIIAMFDPAFGGGDRPVLRFAKLGTTMEGKWGIQAYPGIIIPINANSKNPVHFQLSEAVRYECDNLKLDGVRYTCLPENIGVDSTGEGGGLCDILQRTWSPHIIRIEFGGAASDDPCNLEDIRPAREVYENKSVEMWFRSRDAVNSGQFKGIDKETAEELCNRTFYDYGKRIRLQSKSRDKSQAEKSYKSMFGKSCDLADSCVGLQEVARRKGFRLAAIGQTIIRSQDWEKEVKKVQDFYEAEQFQPEEIDEGELMYG